MNAAAKRKMIHGGEICSIPCEMERATSKSDASDHGEEIRISCCSGGSIHWEEGKGDRKKIVGLIREIGARSWNSKYKKRKKKIIENF